MKRYLKIELKKALTNKWFLAVLGIAVAITFLNSKEMIEVLIKFQEVQIRMGEYKQEEYVFLSLYGTWIGVENHTLGMAFYFFLFPLFALAAYGWSYYGERKSGYVKNVVSRTNKKIYFASKYIATFVAGGLAMVIPMIINIFLTCLYSNFALPDYLYGYVAMMHGSLWAELYFTHPLLFTIGYLAIDFVFCGLIACISMTLAFFIRSRLAVLLLPFFFLLGVDYLKRDIGGWLGTEFEMSPMYFLHPTPFPRPVHGGVILLWMLVLFAITFGICMTRGRKDDVF